MNSYESVCLQVREGDRYNALNYFLENMHSFAINCPLLGTISSAKIAYQ